MAKDKKCNVGRPPKFNSVEDLQVKVDEYFEKGATIKVYKVAGIDVEQKIYTITGLALYLGFCDRYSFYEYESHPQFTYTIKKARARIEKVYEENLQGPNCTGSIFALKNFGWKDVFENRLANPDGTALSANALWVGISKLEKPDDRPRKENTNTPSVAS